MNTLTLNLGKNLSTDLLERLRESFLNKAPVDLSLASCVQIKIMLTSGRVVVGVDDDWTLEISFVKYEE